MSKLIDKLLNSGSDKMARVMNESDFFGEPEYIKTSLPILNIAFSGDLNGGLTCGMTVFSGVSRVFKSLLGLLCVKSYLDAYPDACCLLYDSEFGITPKYLEMIKIDTSRVIHIPIENIELLKFDYIKRLESIERGDKVITLIDSLGLVPSKKEVDDAIDSKSVSDMSRAKAIKSFFRIVTPIVTIKSIPCICITHTYKSMDFIPRDVVSGGNALVYASNQVFIITRAQEKDGTEVSGYKFTINVEKSRYIKEKSKLPFYVSFENGINKYSGLLDLAIEAGICDNPTKGWYTKINTTTGEMLPEKYRMKETNNYEFWKDLLVYEPFNSWIKETYQLPTNLYVNEGDFDDCK